MGFQFARLEIVCQFSLQFSLFRMEKTFDGNMTQATKELLKLNGLTIQGAVLGNVFIAFTPGVGVGCSSVFHMMALSNTAVAILRVVDGSGGMFLVVGAMPCTAYQIEGQKVCVSIAVLELLKLMIAFLGSVLSLASGWYGCATG